MLITKAGNQQPRPAANVPSETPDSLAHSSADPLPLPTRVGNWFWTIVAGVAFWWLVAQGIR